MERWRKKQNRLKPLIIKRPKRRKKELKDRNRRTRRQPMTITSLLNLNLKRMKRHRSISFLRMMKKIFFIKRKITQEKNNK